MMRAAVAVQVYTLITDNMNQGAAKSEFELLLRDVWELYF